MIRACSLLNRATKTLVGKKEMTEASIDNQHKVEMEIVFKM